MNSGFMKSKTKGYWVDSGSRDEQSGDIAALGAELGKDLQDAHLEVS